VVVWTEGSDSRLRRSLVRRCALDEPGGGRRQLRRPAAAASNPHHQGAGRTQAPARAQAIRAVAGCL